MKSNIITEAIQYHKENNIPYSEPIFRYGSVNFFKYINELRNLNESKSITLDEDAMFFINSDLGKIGIYEGRPVLLDFPLPGRSINEMSRSDYAKLIKFLRKVKGKVSYKIYQSIKQAMNFYAVDPYENAKSIIDRKIGRAHV